MTSFSGFQLVLRIRRVLTLVLLALGFAGPLCADTGREFEPMPQLPPEMRANWVSVGVVNAAGKPVISSCTGTLIAPDLVLTAAHCAGDPARPSDNREFWAGWDFGSSAAYGVGAERLVHPLYGLTKGLRRFEYDIALIRLQNPIDPDSVTPLMLAEGAIDTATRYGMVGYHRRVPGAANGRFDCVRLQGSGERKLFLDCAVISGNSGAPVLVQTPQGWQVVAVVVATRGGSGAQAVPVSDWVRQEYLAAVRRAQDRP